MLVRHSPIDILLVEDNPADARALADALQEFAPGAFSITQVDRLKHAAGALARATPDLILLDFSLPDSTGLETLSQMQVHAASVPIVGLVWPQDESMALQALRRGMQDYLVKGQLVAADTARLLRNAIERSRVEKSLMASEERFRLLVDGIRDYAIYILDLEGRVSSWNLGAERIGGYKANEILGRHFSCFYPRGADGADLSQHALATALSQGRLVTEGFQVRKDGTQFWALTSTTALYDTHKKHVGFTRISQDLTERNLLESQLRQAQKMDALGQLTGGIAHDFNNLLTIIACSCGLLLEAAPAVDRLREGLETIRDAGEKGAALTRQLLAFSRQTVLEPAILDLNTLVKDNKEMLRRLLGEDLVLTFNLEGAIRRIKADPNLLVQVLMNMAVNARDAMPQGGKFTVQTSTVDLDESYARLRPEVKAGTYILLSIADTGVGMTPAVRSRIFEPFFTTKPVGKGTGLGLAVVHGIVKQSGGHIEVDSELNIGTTFKIYLPAVEDTLAIPAKALPEQESRGTETILVAEDDVILRRFALLALQDRGYTILQAADGVEALHVAEGHAGTIDLLVTDVMMPRLNGRGLATALRPRFPKMKVLFMSGYTDDAVILNGVLHAQVTFLQKPYTLNALRQKVRQALDQKA